MQQSVPLGSQWRTGVIQEALTFNDILMVPVHSSVTSRANCDLSSRFSKNIPLKIPIVSSPMDTVTEDEMAIGLAQNGGLGVIHRFLPVEEQVEMVRRVKRKQIHVNMYPYIVGTSTSIKVIEDLASRVRVRTFLVTDDQCVPKDFNRSNLSKEAGSPQRKEVIMPLRGILTNRDLKMQNSFGETNLTAAKLMTPIDKLVVWKMPQVDGYCSTQEAQKIMVEHKIEKLPLIHEGNIVALISLKDIEKDQALQRPNRDNFGRLLVGAAVGVKEEDYTRAKKLVEGGVDVLVIDVANGHSDICINAVKKLKEEHEGVDIVAGSVATGEGALQLIKAGADGIRCGIGNGSICITRLVAGCGVPQFTALLDTVPVCKEYNIPLISDGGNKNSGNMAKALAVGADCVMLGRLLAGCDEGPSQVMYREGKLVKIFRGMAGLGANVAKAQRTGTVEPGAATFNAEGVEGYIPYAGVMDICQDQPLSMVLEQYCKGIQSGMSYCGATDILTMQKNVRFIRQTQQGFIESGVHGITKI